MTTTALALAALLALVAAYEVLRYAGQRDRTLANLHRPYGRLV